MRVFVAVVLSTLCALAAGAETSTIRCESYGGAYQECPVQLPGKGLVELQTQLGRAPCIVDETWGVRGKSIWVSGSCRGLFRFTPDAAGGSQWSGGRSPLSSPQFPGRIIRCESSGIARKECPTSTFGGVSLVQQLSILPCTLGQSWGYTSGGIWVDAGCRADFRVGSAGPPPATTVTCESSFSGPTICRTDTVAACVSHAA